MEDEEGELGFYDPSAWGGFLSPSGSFLYWDAGGALWWPILAMQPRNGLGNLHGPLSGFVCVCLSAPLYWNDTQEMCDRLMIHTVQSFTRSLMKMQRER